MPAPVPPAAAGDDSYGEALAALGAGDDQAAARRLWQIVSAHPDHAGAWLDLGLLYCDQGMARAALRIFAHVEQRFAPAPAIRELIAAMRARGCHAPVPQQRGWVRGGLRAGVDSNPNLGLGAASLTLQIGGLPTPVNLAATARPRPSAWQGAELQGEYELAAGWRLSADLLETRYAAGADLAQGRQILGVSHAAGDDQTLLWAARYTLGGETWQQSAGLRHRHRLAAPGWEAELALQRNSYPGRTPLDGWVLEPRLVRRGTLAALGQWQIGAGPLLDLPRHERPGGRRAGGALQAELEKPLPRGWRLEAGLRYQHLQDAEAYSPLFGPTRRRQDLSVAWLSLGHAVAAQTRCDLALQGLVSRDRIPLYNYRQQIVSVGCRHAF